MGNFVVEEMEKRLQRSTKIGINKNVIQFIFNFAERHGKC